MTTYTVTAWCNVAHYTTFEVDAGSIDEALKKGRIQAREECGEPCSDAEYEWDEFEVFAESDETAFAKHIEPSRLAEIAASALLAALRRFEEAWRRWADDIRQHPRLAASTEMFDIYEQACAAITEATQCQGRAP